MHFSLISALTVIAGTLVAADTTLTGFAGADCVGSIINQVSYPGGAGERLNQESLATRSNQCRKPQVATATGVTPRRA